mmetsp:Transcript_19507/g.56743  ORF Transcript_19507/g.56743 Transcript_19507/m.56743 type:complete len:449 (+) Transcript_19507:67-1413(+)
MATAVALLGTSEFAPISPTLSAAATPIVLPVPIGAVKVLPRWAEEDGVVKWRLMYCALAPDEAGRIGNGETAASGLEWVECELRAFTRELPLTGLQHGVAHLFKVALETPHGWSDWSDVVECVPPSPELPGKCAAVLAVVKDDTTAHVRWTRPVDYAVAVGVGQILRYKVLVSWAPDSQRELLIEGDADCCDVPELKCLTDYRFQVAAENIAGWGAYSDPCPPLQMPPPVPVKLPMPTLRRATHHTAVVQWQHPPATEVPIDSFRFRYTTEPRFPEGLATSPHVVELADVPSNASQHTITDLRPGQTYIFQVRAVNSYGMGVWSDSSIPIKTADGREPSKIVNLSAPNLYASFVTLQWPPAEHNGYEVTWHVLKFANKPDLSDAQEMEPTVIRKDGLDTADLRHLKKERYYFQMAAVNSVGQSEWSDTLCVDMSVFSKTQPAALQAPP